MPKVIREKEMPVSRDALFSVITDFAKYPEFLSEVVGVRPEPGATDSKKLITFELEIVKRFEYTLEFNITGREVVEWKLTKSNFFKMNDGKWELKELGPKTTGVKYELEVGFGFLVPGWVSRKLTEVNLPKMFDSFEQRAKGVS